MSVPSPTMKMLGQNTPTKLNYLLKKKQKLEQLHRSLRTKRSGQTKSLIDWLKK